MYFFQENLTQGSFALSSEEAKHIAKSLRLKTGDTIRITDGKGTLASAVISNVYRDSCEVEITERFFYDKSLLKKLHIAVAPTKNTDRMEWLVEKAVEIGVSKITFIFCERSERKKMDMNRLHRIAIAALKQSQGTWLPEMNANSFSQFMSENNELTANKYIAYCDEKTQASTISNIECGNNVVFLIGPEGDFTPQEFIIAKEHGFMHVSFGEKILRTETAALFAVCFAAAYQQNINSTYHI